MGPAGCSGCCGSAVLGRHSHTSSWAASPSCCVFKHLLFLSSSIKRFGFSLGSRSEHSSLFLVFIFSSHDFFFTGRKKKKKSSISLCFFGGGFSSMSLLLLITYFFFNWKWIWDYFILSCTIHIFFFFPSFFLLPCPIFSCASESQPSLRETGDLRAQGEVLFNVPVPPPFIKRRLQVVLVCSLQALHPLA